MPATLKVAVQMDPLEGINIDGDSTFVLMLEAQARGYALWHYEPKHLALSGGRLMARAHPVVVRREKGNHFTFGPAETIDLATMDVVLMRQDPPFDMAYITATHLLEMIHPRTLVVNDPAAVRNAPEKLFVLQFRDLMPETLVTADREAIVAFRKRHGDIVVKPLFGNGGAGVFLIRADDPNLNALLELFTERSREPLMVQRYVPEVRQGDKRIILVEGEPMGAINRVPAEGEARSNMHVGGRPEPTTLHSARARDLRPHRPGAEGEGPHLRRHRRDRRLPHGDQRHLPHRAAGGGAFRWRASRTRHLGRDRTPVGGAQPSSQRGLIRPSSTGRSGLVAAMWAATTSSSSGPASAGSCAASRSTITVAAAAEAVRHHAVDALRRQRFHRPSRRTSTGPRRSPGGAAGSQTKRSPATCGKRPAPGWDRPFSSAARMSAPRRPRVARVLPKGRMVRMSP